MRERNATENDREVVLNRKCVCERERIKIETPQENRSRLQCMKVNQRERIVRKAIKSYP